MIVNDFLPVKLNEQQQLSVINLNQQFWNLANYIEQNVPGSAHRTVVLRKLFEAKMTAVHAISRS